MSYPKLTHCGLTVTIDPCADGTWEYRYSHDEHDVWLQFPQGTGEIVTDKTHTIEQVQELLLPLMEEEASRRIIYLREEGKRMLEEASRLYDVKTELSLQRQQDRITKQREAAQSA